LIHDTSSFLLVLFVAAAAPMIAAGATQLPLVVAITSLGVEQGQMRQSTAVALVTAGVLSVLIIPTLANRLAPTGCSGGRGVSGHRRT
jgi:hypothetical protein